MEQHRATMLKYDYLILRWDGFNDLESASHGSLQLSGMSLESAGCPDSSISGVPSMNRKIVTYMTVILAIGFANQFARADFGPCPSIQVSECVDSKTKLDRVILIPSCGGLPCVCDAPRVIYLGKMQETVQEWLSSTSAFYSNGVPVDTTASRVGSLPRAVAVAPEPLRHAWTLANDAIAAFQQAGGDRDPEPFVVRGEIWGRLGNQIYAIRDFAEAADILNQSRHRNLPKQAEFAPRIARALAAAVKAPGTPVVADARKYWIAGVDAVRSRKFDAAVFNFTDAILLDPQNPSYWYARAMMFKRLGFDREAEQDAQAGTLFEQKRMRDLRPFTLSGKSAANQDLQHLGMWERPWVERFRAGDGQAWRRYPESK